MYVISQSQTPVSELVLVNTSSQLQAATIAGLLLHVSSTIIYSDKYCLGYRLAHCFIYSMALFVFGDIFIETMSLLERCPDQSKWQFLFVLRQVMVINMFVQEGFTPPRQNGFTPPRQDHFTPMISHLHGGMVSHLPGRMVSHLPGGWFHTSQVRWFHTSQVGWFHTSQVGFTPPRQDGFTPPRMVSHLPIAMVSHLTGGMVSHLPGRFHTSHTGWFHTSQLGWFHTSQVGWFHTSQAGFTLTNHMLCLTVSYYCYLFPISCSSTKHGWLSLVRLSWDSFIFLDIFLGAFKQGVTTKAQQCLLTA